MIADSTTRPWSGGNFSKGVSGRHVLWQMFLKQTETDAEVNDIQLLDRSGVPDEPKGIRSRGARVLCPIWSAVQAPSVGDVK